MDAYSSFARRAPIRPAGIDAFDAVSAWRSPDPRRFDTQVANDWSIAPVANPVADEMEPWDWNSPFARGLIIAGGSFFAALMGAMLGGAFSL